MLSRVADNLYWMSRYLERAKHTARLIDVSLFLLLDQNPEYKAQHWKRLFDSLRIPAGEKLPDGAYYNVAQKLMFDVANSSSLFSCINSARDNARQVREQISTEMWEQLNRLFLHIKHKSTEAIWFSEPHEFLTNVQESILLFQGLTDSTMSCNEGWYFIYVGRFIERARAIAALLDVHFCSPELLPEEQEDDTDTAQSDYLDYLVWVGLLRSCSAFDAYHKVYTGNIHPERIAEFLILNPESPHSIRFAITRVQSALQAIAKTTHARHTQHAERLVGRLRASLEYDQIEDIMADIHSYLERIEQQCTHIHNALYQTYIFYPIEGALISEVGADQS